ncbi:hypothetical protein [Saccharopolyspora sp. 5N708]|uniref:hypothetical protein n=1 Tax=Saccharopolyspora sp. 5N708 TaxID=3457424 RepID=UPI003FD69B5B
MADPYFVLISTSELADLASALDVVDGHADLGDRYRKLIADSRRTMADDEIRLTQARGLAKRLMVLVKAAGPNFREELPDAARAELDRGLAQANALVFHPEQD